LAEPADIVAAIASRNRDLEGQHVLITAGPTQEPLDAVRYISNRSSGKMGYALAVEAAARGAHVTLISGPVALDAPSGVDRVLVRTAAEMREQVLSHFESATVIVKCASVADFRPSVVETNKIKKSGASLTLQLEPTTDILAELGARKENRLLIGFTAETENLRNEAKRKLEAKNCDMVVGNLVGVKDSGFESDSNEVLLAFPGGEVRELPRASKRGVAHNIWNEIAGLLRKRQVAVNAG